MAKSSNDNGATLSGLIADFDKTNPYYVQWCADNGRGPSQQSSVVAYLLATNY